MKTKLLFVVFSFLFSFLQVNAQLKVNSNGKVGIGTVNPQYGLLQIGKSGVNNGIAIYDSLTSSPPLKFYTSGDTGFLNFGVQQKGLAICPEGKFAIGATLKPNAEYPASALMNLFVYPSNPSCGLMVYYEPGYDWGDAVKVYASRNTDVAYIVRNIAKGSNNEDVTFSVHGDGTVYAKGSCLTASDESFKEDITEINSGLDKVRNLRGVTYAMKNSDNDVDSQRSALRASSSDSSARNSLVPIEISNRIKAEKKRKKAGFIAQDLEQVFPEAVYTLPDGKKAIAYSEIIPLLVEAIKEQQVQIETLQQAKNAKTRVVEDEVIDVSDDTSAMDEREQAALYSNIPNPFKEETTISYFIPESVSKASLHIYNLQGKQIKQMNLSDRGRNSIVIKGHELNPGMYMYTLIADGKEVDTKKMILTN